MTNNPNGAPVKLEDPKRQDRFLKLIRGGASLAKACELVGLSDNRLVQDHCERDPAFAEKYDDAKYEGFAFRLAVYNKCEKGEGSKTQLSAVRHWLACKDPDGFALKQKHEVSAHVTHKQDVHSAMSKVMSDPDTFAAAEALATCLSKSDEGTDQSGT